MNSKDWWIVGFRTRRRWTRWEPVSDRDFVLDFVAFVRSNYLILLFVLTLRDPPRPGPAHPREHGDSAAPKSLDPKQ